MKRLGLFLTALASPLAAHALIIELDYQFDTGFFSAQPEAKAALEAAAFDLGSALGTSLGEISADIFSGSSGDATATFNWKVNFTNPSTGSRITLDTFTAAPDTIKIYAGARLLTGSTLGQGGPGTAGFSFGGSLNTGVSAAQWDLALDNAEFASNAMLLRGAGPIMQSYSGSAPQQGAQGLYTVAAGAIVGNIWFDSDTNNDGVADVDGWHFNHKTSVAAGKNDFYSVALHELAHAIGFGGSRTWSDLSSANQWAGSEARALNNQSGLNLIDGSHVVEGFMSPRISDGEMQESALAPTLANGSRKSLTKIDVAILRDLGYSAVPEPASGLLVAMGLLALSTKRGQRREPTRDRAAGLSSLS
jgi:hypothetical protein